MFRMFATAAILALTVTAAQAGPVTVRYDDLNASNPADAKVLAERIHDAAVIACGKETEYGGPRHIFYLELYQATTGRCVDELSQSTMERVTASIARRPRYASN